MTLSDLLEALAREGITLEAAGDRLAVTAAPGRGVPPALRERLLAHKPALLALLRERGPEPVEAWPRLTARPDQRHAPFPMTELQQAYSVGRSGELALGAAMHAYNELDCPDLDLPRFERAWNAVVARHEMLRAVALPEFQQQILASVPSYAIPVEDLREHGDEAIAGRLAAIRRRLAHQRLDLHRWPLFELRACLLPGGRTRLFMSIDGTFVDGYSFQIVYRELVALYREPTRAPEPAALELSFRDYALAVHEMLAGERHRRALAYWRERLATLPPAPDLPLARDPAELRQPSFRRWFERLGAPVWTRLQARARARGLTAAELLLAAYAEIVARWSRSPRFTLNVPHFNRLPLHPQIGDIVGTFASFTLVAVEHRPELAFTARARAIRATLLAALGHREVSGVELLRELFRARGQIAGAIMPVVLTSFATHGGGGKTSHWVDFLAREFGPLVEALTQTPQVWIDHQVVYQDDGVFLNWDAADELFPQGMVDAMFAAYVALLRRLAADDERAWDQPWLDTMPTDQRALLERLAANARPLRDRRLHEGFERHARARPDAKALVTASLTLSYGELARRAHRLARALQERGAGPGQVVAIVMEKGWEQVVAVLAIVAAGAAYLPIDAGLPAARREFMLADADASLVVTQPHLRAHAGDRATLVVTPDGHAEHDDGPLAIADADEDALAAVLYTSGSTGQPNGVRLGHRGLVNGVEWTLRRFGVGVDDRLIALSALHHDFSVFDIFGTLAAGATIVLPDAAHRRDPSHWAALMEREGVTLWSTVPAMMEMLLTWQAGRDRKLAAPLRLALLGGDWIPVTMPGRIGRMFPEVEVVSVGGPTETSLWNIAHPVEPGDERRASIPYGRPIANTRYLVLDENLDERPVWVPGELCCVGIGVAWGYVGGRAAEKFTIHPATGARIYRTGDLGRRHPDGTLEFLGRVDFQLSIRGQRIEPGEVEAALVQAPGVAAAVVGAVGEHHDKQLVAWVVPQARGVDVAALRGHLRELLPAHMVPGSFVVLDALPLTANAKVDRRALPPPGATSTAASRQVTTLPSGREAAALAPTIAGLFGELLGVADVDPDRNFFEYGANSVHLIQLAGALKRRLGLEVPVVDLFTYPRVRDLARRLAGEDSPHATATAHAVDATDADTLDATDATHAASPAAVAEPARVGGDIAIIGMSCRFPGAATLDELWANLVAGVESIAAHDEATLRAHGVDAAALADPAYVRASATLADHDRFDAELFGLSPREARALDPQQRVFLECVWEALEHAGHRPDPRGRDGRGRRVGVYAGKSVSHYRYPYPDLTRPIDFFQDLVSQDKDFLATQVSYLFDLGGPSVNLQTACSTSLVAVASACEALLRGDCDVALAGGVAVKVPHAVGYRHEPGSIFASDGHCRPFDAAATGTVPGSGAGVVVLKPLARALADGDRVLALIKGSAINNDGRDKVGFMAPGVTGQAEVVRAAQRRAGVDPASISYVEAHGTGTALGDAIEVAALHRAFGPGLAPGSCALGSVKGNFGHLDSAAGVAGLIKTVLALQHRTLPGTVHFTRAKPELGLEQGPFRVVARAEPWPAGAGPRRAGVSSFGIGGTNAHVILEEAPPAPQASATAVRRDQPPTSPASITATDIRREPTSSTPTSITATDLLREHAPPTSPTDRPVHVLALAARGPAALREQVRRHRLALERGAVELADHCFSTNTGRTALEHRLALVAADRDAAIDLLLAAERGEQRPALLRGVVTPGRKLAFLCAAQGSQHAHVAHALYAAEPRFRARLTELDRLLRAGWPAQWSDPSLLAVLYPAPGRGSPIDRFAWAQPALFALEVALAELWIDRGARPDLIVGHSTGELAAACLAGVFSVADGLRLAVARGRAMEDHSPPGATVAVFTGEAELLALARAHGLAPAIAAYNGPANHVVSDTPAAIDALVEVLRAAGVEHRRLAIPRAPHSALVEPALPSFRAVAEQVRYARPNVPLISGMTGERVDDDVATPDYWCRQLREPVRFAAAVATLAREGARVLIEIGPRSTLLGMAGRCLPEDHAALIPSLREDDGGAPSLYLGLAAAFAAGVDVDWAAHDRDRGRRRVPVPTYPFQRQRFWQDGAGLQRPASDRAPADPTVHPLLGRRVDAATLGPGELLFEAVLGPAAPAFLGEHRIFGAAVVPATGFVEMMLAAGRAALGVPRPSLRDLTLVTALELPDAGRTVQCVVRPTSEPDTVAVEVLARDDGAWTLHASARVDARPRPAQDTADLPALRARADVELRPADIDAFHGEAAAAGVAFGPAFRTITALWRGPAEALARLAPRAEARDAAWIVHPALLDACLQPVGGLALGGGADLWVPVAIEALSLTPTANATGLPSPTPTSAPDPEPSPTPTSANLTELWSHARVVASADERVRADVVVFTADGERWLDLRGLQLERVSAARMLGGAAPIDAQWLYDRRWEPAPARPTPPGVGACTIVGGRELGPRLAAELRARGWTCALLDGDADAAALDAALDHLERAPGPREVVHLASLDAADDATLAGADLLAAARPAVRGALDLLAALARRGRPCGAWLVTAGTAAIAERDASTTTGLLGAPLWGMARAAALESVELDVRCVDLDPAAPAARIAALADEIARRSPDDDDQIALRPPPDAHRRADATPAPSRTAVTARDDAHRDPETSPHADGRVADGPVTPGARRLAARIRRVDAAALAHGPRTALTPGRTHVIAGGHGRLGLRTAELLASRGAAAIVLLGRRPADPAVQPDLERLRAGGTRIVEALADIADADALASALHAATAGLPPLGGVFHCAGALDDGVLGQQRWDRLEPLLRPALAGAWNLHRWTRTRALERFVLFSSIAGLLGSAGQSNHAAASACLDALAWHRRAHGLPATVIDWGVWAGAAGAPVAVGERVRTPGFEPLPAPRALRALELLLTATPTQVAVAAVDWPAFAAGRPQAAWRHLVDAPTTTPRPATDAAEPRGALRRALAEAPAERRWRLLLTWLGEQAAWMLGLADAATVDPERGFHELGIDSLAALKLRNRVQAGLDISLPGTVMFNHPSIASLAARLAATELAGLVRRPGAATPDDAPPAADAALAALDDLSDDNLAALLERQLAAMEDA